MATFADFRFSRNNSGDGVRTQPRPSRGDQLGGAAAVTSRTDQADFNITATFFFWSCRRCGKQGCSTTARRAGPFRLTCDRGTVRTSGLSARFPTGSAVRINLPRGRFCRATVVLVRTRGNRVTASLEAHPFAVVSAVETAVELEPPSPCHTECGIITANNAVAFAWLRAVGRARVGLGGVGICRAARAGGGDGGTMRSALAR